MTSPARLTSSSWLVRSAQIGLWLLALGCLAWVSLDGRFRDAEGYPRGTVCLPLSVALGLTVLAVALPTRLRQAAAWGVLAFVGQAVALQLIQAGPFMRYQHYVPLPRLLTEHPLLLGYLVAQAVLVLVGFRSRWPTVREWLARTFRPWQLLAVGAVFVLTSATVSEQVPVYLMELVFAACLQTLGLGTLVLAVWSVPEGILANWGRWVADWLDGSRPPGRWDPFPWIAALWVTVVAACLSVWSYGAHPHIPDEVAYLYHAKYFAHGVLTAPAPPVREGFEFYLMHFDGDRWFPSPPPGWPAVLALGVLLGLPWLVNPVLGGLNVVLGYFLLRELYDRRTARAGAFLLALSPWFVFMAMNLMTHTIILTCALVAAVAVARARLTLRAAWAALGGAGVGALSLARPLEGLIVAGLLGLWLITAGSWRVRITSAVAFVVLTAAVGGLVLPYNNHLTGEPLRFPINAYTDEYFGPNANAYGFGPDRGMGWPIDPYPGHGPVDAVINANLNTFSINIELFGWSIGSLLFVALAVCCRRLQRSDLLMLATVAAIFVTYFFYYFSGGPDFGARYWYLMIIPLLALTLRGIEYLGEVLDEDSVRGSRSSVLGFWVPVAGSLAGAETAPRVMGTNRLGAVRVQLAVFLLCAFSLLNYFPWRAIDKYHHYLAMRPDVIALAAEHGFGKSLVLVRGVEHPDFSSVAAYNPVDLRADAPVYAWDRDAATRARLLAAYADRPIWLLDGPTLTGGPFRIVAGPLAADEVGPPPRSNDEPATNIQ